MTTYAHIVGWGKYVPQKIVTNDDIAQFMDTSDGWIKSRTGILERRFAAAHETTATMAIAAAKEALDRARIAPAAIDLIVVATLSPEYICPSTACIVQDALGATHAGAYDLSAACSGFIYALSTTAAMIQSNAIQAALVIGSETLSRILNDQDRTTYPLFGDGAGAVVLQASEMPGGVLATVLGSDGSGAEYLSIPAGGSKLPASQETINQRLHYLQMNGREVYRFATKVMSRVAKQACIKAGVGLNEIDLFIPHQANIRIIESARKDLNIGPEKVFTNLEKYGNTSTASIPIALCEAIEQGRVQATDKLVMVGFGGGLTWGASVVQWGVPMPYRRQQWWYRGLRWTVYLWARIRSAVVRTWRRIENLFPIKNGNGTLNGVEKIKDDPTDIPSKNGSKPQPAVIDSPPASLIHPVEADPEKVLESEQPTNGK
ncbi:MAG: beta-ketoacyl-ACP synthase 3 [Anaerolineae bacterium]|nr:beta-ketoacyl-ACP synthase 3 [Anaerolineae bacterium]